MNQVVIPVSYMGSGSSAITDLLSEVHGYESANGNFEYVLLHCPNGLFDLEDKLLRGNNALRSDEALHSFYECMQTLYSCKHFGVADYKHRVGLQFLDDCKDFINTLIISKNPNGYWYFQENPNQIMLLKKAIAKLIHLISLKKIKFGPVLRYRETWLSYPSSNEFYTAAKNFLNAFFRELGIDEKNLILDQFLLPHNLWRFEHYFSNNCKAIVVDRDPRDVFLLNKYYWKNAGCPIPYSYDVKEFCTHYRKMRECEIKNSNDNVLRIHFEDLVYKYNDTLQKIFDFLHIEEEQHILKKTKFSPEKSIKNTQIYNRNSTFKDEADYIKINLSEYLYEFPFTECGKFSMKDIIL